MTGVGRRLPSLLHAGCALVLLNLLALNVGGLDVESYRLLGVLCLGVWLVVGRRRFETGRLWGPTGLLLGAALVVHFRCESQLALTVSASVLVALTCRLLRPDQAPAARCLPLAAALYAVLSLLYLATPAALQALQAAARSWSDLVARTLLDHPLDLGPSLLGFWVGLSLACLVVARFALVEWRPASLVLGLALIGAAHLAQLLTLELLPPAWITRGGMTLTPGLLLVLAVVPLGLHVGAPLAAAPRPTGGPLRALAGTLAAAALLAPALASPLVRGRPAPRVAFYSVNEGPILNWDKPEHGRYGSWSQGMFGLLPETLAADGFQVELLRERLRPEHLEGRDALVTINVNTDWTVEELRTVWSFVEDGGRLLVLGDHTDVEGSRSSQNALLAPTGIAFAFDAALPSPHNAWTGTDLFGHGLLAGIADPGSLGLGVGASLTLADGAARPLVSARHGLSDLGDMSAVERAFLGDYRYQLGETFGDLVLVAEAPLGAGRVLVFGDTSSFQNPALVGGYPFVRQVFTWLTGEPLLELGPWRPRLVGLAGLLALLALWQLGRQVGAVALVPVALLAVWTGVDQLQVDLLERPRLDLPVAWLDMSHGPRLDVARTGRQTVGGLVTNLQRSGLAVTPLRSFGEADWRRGDVFLALAPVSTYTPDEVAALRAFMEQGGLVILTAGHDQKAPVQGLLDAVGLDIDDAPVGPIPLDKPAGRERTVVEYVEAWPVLVRPLEVTGERAAAAGSSPAGPGPGPAPVDRPLAAGLVAAPSPEDVTADPARDLRPRLPRRRSAASQGPRVEVLGRFGSVPLAVRAEVGAGALVLIADPWFFDCDNLEFEDQVARPNILFLKQILDAHRRRTEAP